MSASAKSETTLFVCITCRAQAGENASDDQPRAGARLLAAIEAVPSELRPAVTVVPVECLSNCNRACTVAVTAPGKWTYVLGALDPDVHAEDVLAFARLHQQHEAGLPAWRERPEYIRKNTIARVPATPAPSRTQEAPLP
ncbi:DUF1636 domain-containing protein [Bradyrhizobium ontarionense]|uniref:DUF1636 domain-containing protein n=1 Tax=Bradyrhizobium ontarionense TaxID=2898149 RepID=A0ABY3RBR9_9BRAD|nr:DUF1636 domain-containing protein [Bradyrhizobium sp. A19]UFZ04708.1 DUF1636 domain-containing protein [Bradyrhizobium sp. A19]